MFTINIYLRLALIAVCLLGGTAMVIFLGFWYGFPFLLAGIVLLVGYILLGTVQSAAAMMQNQDYLGAEKQLGLTLKPDWLFVTNRAIFYMLKGSICMGLQRNDEGEEWLKKAQTLKLPSDNERAMIEMQLAGIAMQRQRWNIAKMHLKNAKDMNVTEGVIKDQLKQLEAGLGNQGQMKAAQRMGMMPKGGIPLKPGSKRRMPRPR